MVFQVHQGSGDEIAGENNQVGAKTVYQFHRAANGNGRKVFFIMKIAELSDGESVKLMRQTS